MLNYGGLTQFLTMCQKVKCKSHFIGSHFLILTHPCSAVVFTVIVLKSPAIGMNQFIPSENLPPK